VTFAVEGFTSHLAWSPDGTRLAFINGFSSPQEVFTVDPGNGARGSGPPEQITQVGEVLQLRWSPDGTRLAFDRTDCPGGTAAATHR